MADDLRLFKSLATINRKTPLPALRVQKLTWEKAAALAREWDLKQFARRLDDFAAQSPHERYQRQAPTDCC